MNPKNKNHALFSVVRILVGVVISLTVFGWSQKARASDFHVGPSQTYATIGSVPWYNLQPGDTVYIHHKATPYYEKFLLSRSGTSSQWIRVLGVPGTNGELPIISGNNATTSSNNHYRVGWQAPNLIQWDGVIQIAFGEDSTQPPSYIEVANLQVQDGYAPYRFTAENGQQSNYEGFASCIYARSARHILIRNNVLTNCGQGFYNWTGSSSSDNWWEAAAVDITLRGNYFHDNGHVGSWTEHQTYTESDGVTIEHNRFGSQRDGAYGSQIKDRSAGTVIRYNYIEHSKTGGYDIDLVEPEEGWTAFGIKPTYKQAFVYGNTIYSDRIMENMVHWNEDHQVNVNGRAKVEGGRLFFYNNTVVAVADAQGWDPHHNLFIAQYGAYDCPPGSLPGIVDVRNNIFASLPKTPGAEVPQMRFGLCDNENFNFGKNWITAGYGVVGASITGTSNNISPAGNDPGFQSLSLGDYHLTDNSSAIGLGGSLAAEVTDNYLGQNLAPTQQYVHHQQVEARSHFGIGSDAGAFEYVSGGSDATPPGNPGGFLVR